MKLNILLTIFLLSSIGYSQQVSFEWASRAFINSSSAKFQGKTILVDPFDNVYMFGVHASSTNANFKNNDMILAKFNSQGQKLWYKKYTSKTYAPYGDYTMYWDDNYNIVVGGEMNTIFGTDTLDKYSSAITPTFGVVKFDSSGNYIWSTQVDANVDDEYRFIQLPNGNYALTGEGTVTYKPDSTISLSSNEQFHAYINANGTVNTAKEMEYTFNNINYGNVKRKIFANGNNMASVMSLNISSSPIPGSYPALVFEEFNWATKTITNSQIIKYSGLGPTDYQYDSVERMLYIMSNTGLSNDIIFQNNNDTIHSAPNLYLVIKYDLDGDSLVTYQEFNIGIDYSMFSYDYGLTVVGTFYDSCKNLTRNETYSVLPIIPTSHNHQKQYLLVNFDFDLTYNYYTQYATSVGDLFLFDLTHGNNGNIYGTTDGSAQSYFDTITYGSLGNAIPEGFMFMVGDTSSQQSTFINENLKKSGVNVYPNPANQTLNISSDFNISNIIIYDIKGRVVTNRNYLKSIDVSFLDNGVYFIQFFDITNHIIETKRLIKN